MPTLFTAALSDSKQRLGKLYPDFILLTKCILFLTSLLTAVETYAQHLISEKKRVLVAAYCAHLTAPRRIALYSRLVLSMTHDLPRVTSQQENIDPQLNGYNTSDFDYRSGELSSVVRISLSLS